MSRPIQAPADHFRGGYAFWACACGLVGIWLLAHPYYGLVHDGLLYAGQGLLALKPEVFRNDLFFLFGSQDEYTVFSPLYAWLIGLFGLQFAAAMMLAAAHLLWLSGIVRLVFALSADMRERGLALLFVAAGVSLYGVLLLGYGEGFLTSRPLAEGLVLHGLAWLVAGRAVLALCAVLAGALFHPLMALPGLVSGGLFYAFRYPRFWVLPIAGLIGGLGLALLHVGPFGRLFQTMDPEWFDLVVLRDAPVFLTAWPAEAWGRLIIQVAAALAAVLVLPEPIRRLALAVLITALGGCLVSLIGGEWLHSVLIIQLQVWRSTWLLAVIANLAMGMLFYRLWVQRTNAPVLTMLLAAGAGWAVFSPGQVVMAIVLVAVALQISGRLPVISPLWEKLIFAVGGVALTLLVLVRGYGLAAHFNAESRVAGAVNSAAIDFIVLIAIMAALYRAGWLQRRGTILLALVVLASGLALWDRRGTEQRYLEAAIGEANPFAAYLRTDDQVYWRRGLEKTWFLLQHPGFMSYRQGAGILFSRETAMAYRDRAKLVAPLDSREFYDAWSDDATQMLDMTALNVPDFADLVQVCQAPDGPDAVVLEFAFEGHWIAKWALPLKVDMIREDNLPPPAAYYLYLCRDLSAAVQ